MVTVKSVFECKAPIFGAIGVIFSGRVCGVVVIGRRFMEPFFACDHAERYWMIETSPSPAGRSPQRGRVGAPHEKGGRLFHGNPGRGWAMLLMNRNSGFSIDCCPHPTPSPRGTSIASVATSIACAARERGSFAELLTRPSEIKKTAPGRGFLFWKMIQSSSSSSRSSS